MKKKFFLLIILLISSKIIHSQQSFIEGNAGYYKGKEIALYSYSDLITYTTIKESSDTIDENGQFKLTAHLTKPQCYQLRIENKVAKIYMLTLFKYGVTFPKPDTLNYHNPSTDESVDLIIHGDSTELNARIIDFNEQFDAFWENNYSYFVTKKLHGKLDSFQLKMQERYKQVKSNYFKNYINYTFALINNNTGRHRNQLASRYLINQPIEYHNFEYMDFFNQFFKQYLQSLTSGKLGNNLLNTINEEGSAITLDQLLKSDNWLQNDSLRELVMIKGLFELYYVPDFNKASIQSMIEEIIGYSKIQEHKIICSNIIRIFKNLQTGSEAPNFAAKDINGKTYALSDFKKQYIYLNFFGINSNESLQELKKMEKIYGDFKNYITFISVCTDNKTSEELKQFLKKNTNYKWLFLDAGNRIDILQQYVVKAPNTFYLINREHYLVQSPAKKPSEGIEFKFKEMFKSRRR
jgi:peroxiredoxin